MNFFPLPTYFIVKINKETQSSRKEKVGSLYLHFKEVYMQRNMQYGEIVAIGSDCQSIFPKCKVGDILIFHHFVEGSETNKSNILHEDETDNYYYVTSKEFNGHRNETYGYFNGDEIIPHPDFVFINNEVEEKQGYENNDDYIDKNTQKVGSLILFNDWTESREEREEKAQGLMSEIKNQTKGQISQDAKVAIEQKQKEAESITANLSKKEYKPYPLAYHHSPNYKNKNTIYALSIAADTELEFMDKKYKIINTKYCAASA